MKTETRTASFYDPATGTTTQRSFECCVPTPCEWGYSELDDIDDIDRRLMARNNGAAQCTTDW